jgi:hypothetical protein
MEHVTDGNGMISSLKLASKTSTSDRYRAYATERVTNFLQLKKATIAILMASLRSEGTQTNSIQKELQISESELLPDALFT